MNGRDVDGMIRQLFDHGRAVGEQNDCAVRAVAAAAEIPYAEAHRLLAENGRRPRRGTYPQVYQAVLRSLGFKLYPLERPRCTQRTVLGHLSPVGTYLVRLRRHVFCVKDGAQIDVGQRSLKRVVKVLAVVREGSDPTDLLVCGKATRRAASKARGKNFGIGAFMRERLKAGDAPSEIVRRVREKFPVSTATVKDVYMVRRKMKEET